MQLTDAQRLDWLRLIRSEGIGPRTFRSLISRFGSAASVLDALPSLSKRAGKPVTPPAKAEVEREMAASARLGIRFVAMGEADYPRGLHATDAAPPLLAVRGNLGVLAKPALAIVGSRNASAAGLSFTGRIANEAGEAGLLVVSGLARGIDASAHKAALATGTVAVLAGGQDRIYPANHQPLAQSILDAGGAVVSEMPLGWEPRGRDFPRRNRIISGLALGTLVVEAARRSGSLITARYALEQGREVFAVPGSPLDPRAEGTNDLIRQGATLVAEISHILTVLDPLVAREDPYRSDGLGLGRPALKDQPDFWDEIDLGNGAAAVSAIAFDPPEPDEPRDDTARLIGFLSPTPVAVDELARASGLAIRVVQTTLLELELDGRVERHGSGAVSLVARG